MDSTGPIWVKRTILHVSSSVNGIWQLQGNTNKKYSGDTMFLHFARGLKQGVGAGFPPAITQTHQYMPQALRVLRLADGFDHMA